MRTTLIGRWLEKNNKPVVVLLAAGVTLAMATLIDASSSSQVEQVGLIAVPRTGHAATALADGRVLITGGRDSAGIIVATAEVFDPANETSTAIGVLNTARIDHTATLLADGRVLIAGGTSVSGALTSVEIFDPANPGAGFRVLSATMGAARTRHTATRLHNGTVLIAGGDAAGTAEIFNPTTETFSSALLAMAAPRIGHTATLFSDDSVLLAGGNTDSMEYFSSIDQTFTLDQAKLTATRTGHDAISLSDTHLLFFGGDIGHTIDEFNTSVDALSLKATMDGASSSATLLANGKILVLRPDAAGIYAPDATDQATAFTLFDETSVPGSTALLRSGQTATELSGDKKILVAGGVNAQQQPTLQIATYNPARIWTDKDDYVPGDDVILSGSGWKPNENVYLYAVDDTTEAWTYGSTATADANGGFVVNPFFVVQLVQLGANFSVSAVGAQSAMQADVKFTDAGSFTYASNPSPASLSIPAGNGDSLTESVTAPKNNGTFSATLVMTGTGGTPIPASWMSLSTGAQSFATGNSGGSDVTNNWTVTINVPSGTANGTYTGTITASVTSGSGPNTGGGTPVTVRVGATNSGRVGAVTVGSQSGTLTAGTGGTATYTVTVNRGATGNLNPTLTIGPLPSGAAGTFSPGTLNFASNDSSKTSTLTITTTNSTPAGTTNFSVTATSGTDVGTGTGSLNVGKATPTITWANPADIIYGTALSATQLNATASVPGTFLYTPAAGTVLNAGNNQTLSVTFTPTDTTNYNGATKTVSINVLKATPTITWSDPADIVYGTLLSGTQLNATASVPGSFAYSPTAGTKLSAGNAQSLSVTFTPTDTTNYNTANKTVHINVLQAAPTITWSDPADITYGTALSATQLNATASFGGNPVPGSFAYNPAAGTKLNVGNAQPLMVTFTPTDTATYKTATATVHINVLQATPTITWSDPADITYGTALSGTQLNATASFGGDPVAGSFAYNPAAGTKLNAGNAQTLSVTFTPTDTTNYETATATVHINVLKAAATVVVTPYTSATTTYDGHSHTATVTSITGVNGETGATVGTVDVSHTTHTDAGTYASDYWTFTGGANYKDIAATTITDSIAKANATVVITPYTSVSTTYDGHEHTATVTSITGVNGETGNTVGTVNVSHTAHTNAGTYATDYWTFTGGTNYNDIAATTITDSIAKANATVVVTPYTSADTTYDGNPHTATVTSVTGVNGETGNMVGTVDVSHTTHIDAGTYSTDYWTFIGTANYNDIGSTTITDSIAKADPVVTATGGTFTYDGNPHAGSASAKGVKGEDLTPLNVAYRLAPSGTLLTSAPVDAGSYLVAARFAGNNNYNAKQGDAVSLIINKANAVINVTAYHVTYDGDAHTASGSAKGVETTPADLSSLLHLGGTTHTNAGDYTGDSWTFDGNNNYNATSGTVDDSIAKADATISVVAYHVTYDGDQHAATGSVKGVKGETLTGLDLSGTTHIDAGTYTDSWTFTDSTGNYNNASSTVTDQIDKADPVVTATGGTFTYDGNPHAGSGTATGAKGEDLTPPVNIAYRVAPNGTLLTAAPVNAGNYLVAARFAGNNNYNAKQSDPVSLIINKVNAVIDVKAYHVTYDGNPHTATGSAKGVESTPVDLTSLLHLDATTHTNAGDYMADPWTFDGNSNYNPASGTVHDTIDKAAATITVTAYSVIYDGDPHTATGAATGVKGEALTGLDLNSTTHTDAGSFTDAWTFTDATGNYNNAGGTVDDSIAKADPIVTATGGTFTYDGNPHAGSPTAIGVKGENLTPLNVAYRIAPNGSLLTSAPVNAGSYLVAARFAGNSNYNQKQSDAVSLIISKAHLTVTAENKAKTYDGTAFTAFTATIIGFVPGETMSVVSGTPDFTGDAVGAVDAGNYTITPTVGSLSAANYDFTPFKNGTLTIDKADANITVTPYHVTYDSHAHSATGFAQGIENPMPVDLTSLLHLDGTTHTDAGDYASDSWTFDGNNNYKATSGTVHDLIDKASATITVTAYDVIYDGNPHIAGGSAKGVNDEILNGLDLSGTTHTNSGNYMDAWTFTDVTGNYNNASSTVIDKIAKANAVIVATGYSVTYDGNPHTATGTATGVKGESLMGLNLSGTTHTNAGAYNADSWTFTDVTGNYYNANGTVNDAIAKANATITVTPYNVTFDNQNHAATATVKGVKSENLVGIDLSGTTHKNAGTYNNDPWTFTDVTGNYNNASGTVNDSIGKANLAVKADDKSIILHAALPQFTVTYTGFASGDSQSSLGGTLTFTPTTTPANAGTYDIVPSGCTSNNYTITFQKGTLTVMYSSSCIISGDPTHTILQPINPDGSSVSKAGSTVPAKFRVADANCNSIGTPGVVTSFKLIAQSSDPSAAINEDVVSTTPDTAFRWDPTAQQWIFNISTKGMKANVKYTYQISLNDGSSILFSFALK